MSHRAYARILLGLFIICVMAATAHADEAADKYEQAKDLYNQNRFDEALPLIEDSISLNEKSSNSWNLKGLILMNLGRDQEALGAYNRSIELKPTNYIAYNNKGLAHKHLGQYQEALEAFDASIRVSPTYTFAYYNKGNLQMVMGRFPDAIRSLDSALSYDPHYANAYYAKGLVYQKTNEHEKAIESFSHATEENPKYKEAWYGKGISFSKIGRNEDAVASFSQALLIDPNYIDAKTQRDLLLGQTSNNSTILPGSSTSVGGAPFFTILVISLVFVLVGIGFLLMKSGAIKHVKRGDENQPIREYPQSVSKSSDDTEKITDSPQITCDVASLKECVSGISSVKADTNRSGDTTNSEKGVAEGAISGQPPRSGESSGDSSDTKTPHHDVFISYSSQDKSVADAVCAGLEAKKIRCWIAPRDLLPGMMYQEGIIRAIEDCRVMVFIFSSHSNNSPHIIRELTKAVSTGSVIIPFRIEEVVPSKSMEYLIGAPHWLDALTPPLEAHIHTLVNTVESLLQHMKK